MQLKSRILLATVASACIGGAAIAAEHKGLDGTSWKLLQLGQSGTIEGKEPTLSFKDGKVSGSGGCNSFDGPVTTSGEVIEFGALTATKKSCGEQVDAQEAAYMKALKGAQTFENRATSLLINTKEFNEPLSFVPAES